MKADLVIRGGTIVDGSGAQAWLDALVADLDRFRGQTPWSDDLTALTFHYLAGGRL